MLIDSHPIRKIALRITLMVPFLMYGSAHVLLAQGAQDYIVSSGRAPMPPPGQRSSETPAPHLVQLPPRQCRGSQGAERQGLGRSPERSVRACRDPEPSGLCVSGQRERERRERKGKPGGGGGGGATQVIPAGVARVGRRPAARMVAASALRSSIPVSISPMRTLRARSTPSTHLERSPVRTTRATEHTSRASSRPATTAPMSSAWRRRANLLRQGAR